MHQRVSSLQTSKLEPLKATNALQDILDRELARKARSKTRFNQVKEQLSTIQDTLTNGRVFQTQNKREHRDGGSPAKTIPVADDGCSDTQIAYHGRRTIPRKKTTTSLIHHMQKEVNQHEKLRKKIGIIQNSTAWADDSRQKRLKIGREGVTSSHLIDFEKFNDLEMKTYFSDKMRQYYTNERR